MNRFAQFLDALSYEPGRNGKLRLMTSFFAEVPDPERGYALAALTGALEFRYAKPSLIRELVSARVDPVLFKLSYDYVGDLAETTALIWPARPGANAVPGLSDVVETLRNAAKAETPGLIERWLDALDANGRWALIKLVTGGLRVGVSARLAKTAVAQFGDLPVAEIEELWHGLDVPYTELFEWAGGKAEKPVAAALAPFRPVMLAHPIADTDFEKLAPDDFAAEWKWDGIRVQAVSEGGVRRLYSRTGDDISRAFPDVVDALDFEASIDGELLVGADGVVRPFADLQKRLNRKTVSKKMLAEYPAFIRAYDALVLDGDDLRALPFAQRRARLETWHAVTQPARVDLSPQLAFDTWETLAAAREYNQSVGVEGLMLKRADSVYLPGRPKGQWWKWKRDPHVIDAVLMYAQRGHGKRSSFYSDYTFGVWRDDELVPVGKAYFGFTDDELKQIDTYVRGNTTNRFGPVREVTHTHDTGLVFEVAFDGLNRSTRHKSGVAMRFPRISRLRWDKSPAEADVLETLEKLISTDA
ncbi:cisplatin damage response ATP-dependent DNA ligase [Pyruvatibacter sp.]|uniref:cisplatin damage response ATP-dependent DNA ligase n=1 Tax=Pyruvatibacter sp. TaxID=1981328 RepID=UPI0032ECD884